MSAKGASKVRLAAWAVVLLAGVASGMLGCAALVVRRRRLPGVGAFASATSIALLGAAYTAWRQVPTPDTLVAVVLISTGAVGGGYALAAALLPALTDRRGSHAEPALPRVTGSGVGVVLLSDAEPTDYDPTAVGALLGQFDDTDIALPPNLARPLVYAAERSQYARVGSSPSRGEVRRAADALSARMSAAGDPSEVIVAFAQENPSLGDAVAALVAHGCSRVLVVTLAVSPSPSVASLISENRSLAGRAGVSVEATDPLWSSTQLVEMMIGRVIGSLGDRVAEGGVCLVSAGEPRTDRRGQERTRAETTFFAQRVRAELVANGLPEEHVRRAWLQWDEPDVPEVVRHLTAVGARRIVLVPLDFPVESLQTLVDLRFLAEHASIDTGSETAVLPAWGSDPLVIDALFDRVQALRAHTPAAG